jgi:hypothetical protein
MLLAAKYVTFSTDGAKNMILIKTLMQCIYMDIADVTGGQKKL